jgi:hypothetical protein
MAIMWEKCSGDREKHFQTAVFINHFWDITGRA